MRRSNWWSATIVCFGLVGVASAEPGPSPVRADSPVTTVLPNGLLVVARADLRSPFVAIDIRYGVGDAMDPSELPGLAQGLGMFLEGAESAHLRYGDSARFTAAARLVPRERTVHVTTDATHVTTVVPAAGLELALWLEAEAMGFASGRALSLQLPEWATSPLQNLDAIVQGGVFGPSHPYFVEVPEQTSPIVTLAFARQWLHEWNTPANASITIAGDVNPAIVPALVEKYFGPLGGHAPVKLPNEAPRPAAREIQVSAPVATPTFELTWATPGYLQPDNVALGVAARLLERSLQRRFGQNGHADRATVVQRSMRLGSVFAIRADLSDSRWEGSVAEEVEDDLAALRHGDVPDADLAIAKRLEVHDAALARNSLGARTRWDSEAFAATGQLAYFPDLMRQLGVLDAPAVVAAVTRHLTDAGHVVVRVEPKVGARNGGLAEGAPQRSFEASRPAAAPTPVDDASRYHAPGYVSPPPFAAAEPKEGTTTGGVRVVTLTQTESPLVELRVFAPWSAAVPALEIQRAVPQAVAMMTPDGEPLEMALRSMGAASVFTGDSAGLSVSVSTTPDAVGNALRLILKALRTPSLPPDAAEGLRKRLTVQSTTRAEPGTQIHDASGTNEWPPSTAPDVPTTTPFKQDELVRAVRTSWTQDLTVYVVGPLSLDAASSAVAAADGNARVRPRSGGVPAVRGASAAPYALVQDDRSTNASLAFSCVVPDAVAPVAAVDAIPAFLGGVLAALPAGNRRPPGNDPGIPVRHVSAHVVRLGASTLVHVAFGVPASGDDVRRAVATLLDRVESLEERSFTRDDARQLNRALQARAWGGLDGSVAQLERLYELGPAGFTFDATVRAKIEFVDVQSAARHCFTAAALHAVGYGQIREAAAVLKERGYGPIAVSTAGGGAVR